VIISSKETRRSFIEMISKELVARVSIILKVSDLSVGSRLEFAVDEEV